MTFGPIDLIALEFDGNNFNHEVITDLTELVSGENIRILDLVIVHKQENREVIAQEWSDLAPETIVLLEPLRAEISGLITVEDIKLVGKSLKQNTTAAIMLFENLWAVRLKQDLSFAGGRLVMHEHIPSEVVAEAIKDLAEYDG